MQSHGLKVTISAVVAAMSLMVMPSCSDDDYDRPEASNAIPGQDVGIRELKLTVPRMGRFDGMIDHASCRIHITGRNDHVTYPVTIILSADEEKLTLEAEDPILAELPHQLYHLNYITFPHKRLTTKATDEAAEVKEDTVFVGARLSMLNPDHIVFLSSFNVGADRIGNGSEDDPYAIASGVDFKNYICNPMVHGETHEGVYFEVTRNINLNSYDITYGKGWEPAGHNGDNGAVVFNGNLDGLDNSLDDLFCFTDEGYGGLFYKLGPKAHIHNLNFSRVSLDGNKYLGTVACYSESGARLDSISVDGSIDGTAFVGGLIGDGNVSMTACSSSITISASGRNQSMKTPEALDNGDFVGGFIGRTSSSDFTDCLRMGHIYAGNAKCVGGFVGGGYSTSSRVSITRCYSSGNIEGDDYIGGFFGNICATITDSHAGAILERDSYTYQWIFRKPVPYALAVQGEYYVGGLIGYAHSLRMVGSSSFMYSSGTKPAVKGGWYVGGLVGSCPEINDEGGSEFTTNAYIADDMVWISTGYGGYTGSYVGGIAGTGAFGSASGTYINNGNLGGDPVDYVGGIFGQYDGRVLEKVTCRNTGTVSGDCYVGGIAGYNPGSVDGAVLQSEGNIVGDGYLGGIFGKSGPFRLAEGSYVGKDNGSMKIESPSQGPYIGGISGLMELTLSDDNYELNHCPVNINILATANYVGGLIGYAHIKYTKSKSVRFFVGTTQYPCNIDITVNQGPYNKTTEGYQADDVGGVFGYLYAECVENYYPDIYIRNFSDNVQGNIRCEGNYVGGLIGRYETNHVELYIMACHNFINLTSLSDTNVDGYGGILGATLNNVEHLDIERCSNHGNIYGPSLSASGGIAGLIKDELYIEECYNAGTIDGSHGIGGIVGRLTDTGKIEDSFNMGNVPWAENKTLLAGIIGQKEDKSKGTVTLETVYNVGSTGWGIIGGESGSKFKMDDVHYLNTASDGDMKKSGAKSRTADEMRGCPFRERGSRWTFHDGQAAPTLTYVPMFGKPLPLQK